MITTEGGSPETVDTRLAGSPADLYAVADFLGTDLGRRLAGHAELLGSTADVVGASWAGLAGTSAASAMSTASRVLRVDVDEAVRMGEAVEQTGALLAELQDALAGVRADAAAAGLSVSGFWIRLPAPDPARRSPLDRLGPADDLDRLHLVRAFEHARARTRELMLRWSEWLAQLDGWLHGHLKALAAASASYVLTSTAGAARRSGERLRSLRDALEQEAERARAEARRLRDLAYLDEILPPDLYRRLDLEDGLVRAAEAQVPGVEHRESAARRVAGVAGPLDRWLTVYAVWDDMQSGCESLGQAATSQIGSAMAGGATGAAVGSAIPIPIVGTVVGLVAGVTTAIVANHVIDESWELALGEEGCAPDPRAAGARGEGALS